MIIAIVLDISSLQRCALRFDVLYSAYPPDAHKHKTKMGGYSKKIIREGELRKSKDATKIKEKIFPKRGDEVEIHYVVKQKNSETVIDSSRQKSIPYRFQCGQAQIIRGVDEAVLKMSLGERAILNVSSNYGYGKLGVQKIIRPCADLVIDVEILAINGEKAKLKFRRKQFFSFYRRNNKNQLK